MTAVTAALGVAGLAVSSAKPPAGQHHVAPSTQPVDTVRQAAVRNILADRAALAVAQVPSKRQLKRVMARYMSRLVLRRSVDRAQAALRKVSAWPGWEPPREVHLDVTAWEPATIRGRNAVVTFIGYESSIRGGSQRIYMPRQRYRVRLHWEDGWKTVSADARWLTSEGPLGTPGNQGPP